MTDVRDNWIFIVHESTDDDEADQPFELECERCDLKVTSDEIRVLTTAPCGDLGCPSCADGSEHIELICRRCYAKTVSEKLH